MKAKNIFSQILIPIISIVTAAILVLTVVIAGMLSSSYQNEVYERNSEKTKLASGEIAAFMDGAFSMTEEMAKNPSILTMDTAVQTPILEDCVKRNDYLELLYIQDKTGMQTARSSGVLADRSTRWWFVQTMSEQKSFISKSYYSVNTGMPCASIFFPMYQANDLVGVFAVDIKLDYLQGIIEEMSDTKQEEYSFVIDGEGVVVAHPDSAQIEELYNYNDRTKTVSVKDASGNVKTDADGNILTQEQELNLSKDYQKVISDVMSGQNGHTKLKNEGKSYYVTYEPISMKGDSDSWSVITVQSASKAMGMVYQIIAIMVIVSIVAVVLASFTIAKLAKKMTSPILALKELVDAASTGDFSKKADESSQNEIGALASGFNRMSEQISSTISDMNSLSLQVVNSSDKLADVEDKTDMVTNAVQKIKDGTGNQTEEVQGVVIKASELESKFGILREQSAKLLANVDKTLKSEQSGVQSVAELEKENAKSTEMIEESYHTIVNLETQSKEIFGIIDTINEISSQTSLLALNASIEAARAGEAGRGFSVVAESIGKLANDSSQATASIEAIINKLCEDIRFAVSNIQQVNGVVKSQADVALKVQETFGEFKEMADDISGAVREVETLIGEMDSINQDMVVSVEKIKEISGNNDILTDEVSNELKEQLEAIKLVSEKVYELSKVTTQNA